MREFFGVLLMAIGALIAILTGLCSGIFMISILSSGDASTFVLVLLIGGIPFAVGLAMFFGGRALYQSGRSDPE